MKRSLHYDITYSNMRICEQQSTTNCSGDSGISAINFPRRNFRIRRLITKRLSLRVLISQHAQLKMLQLFYYLCTKLSYTVKYEQTDLQVDYRYLALTENNLCSSIAAKKRRSASCHDAKTVRTLSLQQLAVNSIPYMFQETQKAWQERAWNGWRGVLLCWSFVFMELGTAVTVFPPDIIKIRGIGLKKWRSEDSGVDRIVKICGVFEETGNVTSTFCRCQKKES